MRWDAEDHPDEETTPRAVSLRAFVRRMAPLLRPHGRRSLFGVALMVVATAADLSGPLVLQHLVDNDLVTGKATGDLFPVIRSASLYLGLFVLARAAGYGQLTIFVRMGLSVVTALKKRTFEHLLSLSLDHFDKNPPGRLMARVESDAERLLALFSDVGIALAGTVLMLVATVALMLVADARIAAGVIALIVPLALVNMRYISYLRPFYARARRVYARLSAFLAEYVQAVPVIQVYGLEAHAEERLTRRNAERLHADVSAAFREYPFWGMVQAAEVGVVMAILWVGSGQVLGSGMTVGTLVLFIEYARRLFQPIAQFSEQLNFVSRALVSADRVFEVLETPSRTPDAPGALAAVPADWKELSLDSVVFSYGDPSTELRAGKGRRAVDDASFRVKRGERVALVGVSGGGKSTIASLLLRFYDPTSGQISLDGRDIRGFTKSAWRKRVALVLQDVQLFPGTVRENLSVFRSGVPDADLERALDIVGARDLVSRLPKGLETELAEGGSNLSMGERQLVSFARAVTRDPDILVLDEATSSVDPATEKRLQASLEAILTGRTAIIIAHRLETVRRVDRIFVLHGGRVAEEGKHDELYAKGGLYRDLVDLQLGASHPVPIPAKALEEAAP